MFVSLVRVTLLGVSKWILGCPFRPSNTSTVRAAGVWSTQTDPPDNSGVFPLMAKCVSLGPIIWCYSKSWNLGGGQTGLFLLDALGSRDPFTQAFSLQFYREMSM